MTSTSTFELPPLPPKAVVDRHLPTGIAIHGFTAAQMEDYARAAVELNRRAESEDVAALRNALEQALDDMDEDGQCVCLATKDLMRAALAAQGEQG